MNRLPQALAEQLSRSVSTVCTCWILRRTDAVALGFTDHDGDLELEGVTCRAASGLTAADAVREEGFSADPQDVEGVLQGEAITRQDLDGGLYDLARVEEWLVDWSEPVNRVRLRTSILGPLSTNNDVFRAELRGLTSLLDRRLGRSFGRSCDARLGDDRCGIDLSDPTHRGAGTVVTVADETTIHVQGLSANRFQGGALRWTGGANAGRRSVLAPRKAIGADALRLLQPPPAPIDVGDTFEATVGCDRSFETCRTRFANAQNFRGFPHMPGEDFAVGYVSGSAVHDGSPLID